MATIKGKFDTIAAVGDYDGVFAGAELTSARGQARVAFDMAEETLADFRRDAALAGRNSHFSDAGKVAAKQTAASRALDRLAGLEAGPLAGPRARLAKLREQLRVDPIARDDAVAELRAQEVRRVVLERDELVRQTIFHEAIEQGDSVTFAAFTGAAPFFRILPADVIEAGRHRWAELRDPAVAREAQQLAQAIAMAEGRIRTATTEIKRAAGLRDDPIEVLARTGALPAA